MPILRLHRPCRPPRDGPSPHSVTVKERERAKRREGMPDRPLLGALCSESLHGNVRRSSSVWRERYVQVREFKMGTLKIREEGVLLSNYACLY